MAFPLYHEAQAVQDVLMITRTILEFLIELVQLPEAACTNIWQQNHLSHFYKTTYIARLPTSFMPDSHQIFRGIKDTLGRRTLEDDGKGRRKLLIKHRALTKFLWISVTFDTGWQHCR